MAIKLLWLVVKIQVCNNALVMVFLHAGEMSQIQDHRGKLSAAGNNPCDLGGILRFSAAKVFLP